MVKEVGTTHCHHSSISKIVYPLYLEGKWLFQDRVVMAWWGGNRGSLTENGMTYRSAIQVARSGKGEREQAPLALGELACQQSGEAGSAITPGTCGDGGDELVPLSQVWLWKPRVPLKAVLLKSGSKPQKDEQTSGLGV